MATRRPRRPRIPVGAVPRWTRASIPERSEAAVVVRSSMIAISTIASPETNAEPTSRDCRAWSTGPPRPGPLISVAMVAIESAAIVHWLIPTTIVRRAMGSWTLSRVCHAVPPMDSTASSVTGETARMPCSVMRTSGGSE